MTSSRPRYFLLFHMLMTSACGWEAYGDPVIGGDDGGQGGSGGVFDPEQECGATECRAWCDAAGWGGQQPDETTDVVINPGELVIVDCDARARSIRVEAGGELRVSRTRSTRLELHGNLVVEGLLDYGSSVDRIRETVEARIVFVAADESAVVGTPIWPPVEGPDDAAALVVPTDHGLWVVGDGVWTAAGALKKSWSFLHDGVGPLDLSLVVADAAGWQVGDRLVFTPTGTVDEEGFAETFTEAAVASVSGNLIAIDRPPAVPHAGCNDCLRRGEVINLSRNVVIEGAPEGRHAHVMVAQRGRVELDSVALRHLGPAWPEPDCGAPERRAPLYFLQQGDAGRTSSVRHLVVEDAGAGVIAVENTHGVAIEDVAAYDVYGDGVRLFERVDACEVDCPPKGSLAPRDVVVRDTVMAKIAPVQRPDGCLRISHRFGAFVLGGHDGSGCDGCVAVGVQYVGDGRDPAGFSFPEHGRGDPDALVFQNVHVHNSRSHGIFIWQHTDYQPPVSTGISLWSLGDHGISLAGGMNPLRFADAIISDTVGASVHITAQPAFDELRMSGATLESLLLEQPLRLTTFAQQFADLRFSGAKSPAVTRTPLLCDVGNPADPDDPDCSRLLLRIDGATFPSGVVPFVIGEGGNHHSVWEIRGFSHPDHPDLPPDFDLYPPESAQAGGVFIEAFGAWLVPR